MKPIRAGIINESTKLFYRFKYKMLLIVIGILVIALGGLSSFIEGHINILLFNLPLDVLSILNILIVPLISFMAVADLFVGEQESGVIKAIITRPVTRNEILISKTMSILIYEVSILAVTFIIGTIMGITFGRTEFISIPQIFIAYVMSILPIIPTIFFSTLISQLSKNSSSSVMFSMLIYIIIRILTIIIPSISPMIFISYTNWYKLFIGAQIQIKSILRIVGLFAGYSLIFFSGAYTLFEKREY